MSSGSRLPCPSDTPRGLAALMASCWMADPVDRPTPKDIRTAIMELQQGLQFGLLEEPMEEPLEQASRLFHHEPHTIMSLMPSYRPLYPMLTNFHHFHCLTSGEESTRPRRHVTCRFRDPHLHRPSIGSSLNYHIASKCSQLIYTQL